MRVSRLFAICLGLVLTGAAQVDSSYILGAQDVIEISAQGHADFLTRGRITPEGTVQLPYIGVIAAANKTITELGSEIAKALEKKGIYSNPIVKVDVVGIISRNVTVLGQVANPGVVPMARAFRLSEVIAQVGGVREDGADYVILRSPKGPEKRYPLRELATGDISQDPTVAPGDKIFVPKADIFYVSGQVKTPGTFPLSSDMTLRMAIARGGGLTETGSETRIKITRGGKIEHLGLDSKIQAGDVIVVGERLF